MSKKIIQLNEGAIKEELSTLVRDTVEKTLNELLDQEADRLTNARRYERSEDRVDTRAGHYDRKLLTKAGEVNLKMPKLRTLTFETAIIQRYQKREISVEEALVEMYLAGVSVRRVEDVTEVLWGSRVSAGTISELNKKVYVHIEEWRQRPLQGKYPYVYLDGIYLKRNWGGEYENVAVLVAMAVNEEGYREIIGAAEGMKEDKASWLAFLQMLKQRGLEGTQLFIEGKIQTRSWDDKESGQKKYRTEILVNGGRFVHVRDCGRPAGTRAFVRPNKYEPKRAHICVFNWDKADKVAMGWS